ncbi:MAG: ABC transporter ATP-binding protein, partial [Pseudomonadota bacterium]
VIFMLVHVNYYPLRNHLIEFLVNRSKQFQEEISSSSYDPKNPPVVRPTSESMTMTEVKSA